MTNLEFYGYNNIEDKSILISSNTYVSDLYYKSKHSKENILLKTFYGTRDEINRRKAEWLLSEPNHTKGDFGNDYTLVNNDGCYVLYKMKHSKRC